MDNTPFYPNANAYTHSGGDNDDRKQGGDDEDQNDEQYEEEEEVEEEEDDPSLPVPIGRVLQTIAAFAYIAITVWCAVSVFTHRRKQLALPLATLSVASVMALAYTVTAVSRSEDATPRYVSWGVVSAVILVSLLVLPLGGGAGRLAYGTPARPRTHYAVAALLGSLAVLAVLAARQGEKYMDLPPSSYYDAPPTATVHLPAQPIITSGHRHNGMYAWFTVAALLWGVVLANVAWVLHTTLKSPRTPMQTAVRVTLALWALYPLAYVADTTNARDAWFAVLDMGVVAIVIAWGR